MVFLIFRLCPAALSAVVGRGAAQATKIISVAKYESTYFSQPSNIIKRSFDNLKYKLVLVIHSFTPYLNTHLRSLLATR